MSKPTRRRKTTNPATEAHPRGRPGRRTAQERADAVLDLLAGKASVDQISRRLGVKPETVEKWREVAQEGVLASLKLGGTEKSARERELEKELKSLEKAFTRLAIRNEVAERELKKRGPTLLGRSPR